MTNITYLAGEKLYRGYLALPENGKGRGILVLHAWWGLNDFFKSLCDRLAAQGMVAFAPDLNEGKIAATVDEAQQLIDTRDFSAAKITAEAAMQFLRGHPLVSDEKLAAIGFSMGAAHALLLNEQFPESYGKLVLFYGPSEMDVSASQARIQFHFAENDTWEPVESVKKMHAPEAEIHIYPGVGHWFFESDRPDAFDQSAADLAWQRLIDFLAE